jgi:cobalt/nickel transport system permease protein
MQADHRAHEETRIENGNKMNIKKLPGDVGNTKASAPVPGWLMASENYKPAKDSELYIDKSIVGILSVLSRVRGGDRTDNGVIYRVESSVKLLCMLFTLVLLSLTRSMKFIILADSLTLLMISMLNVRDIARILGIMVIITSFSALLLLPFALTGGLTASLAIILKITGCAAQANVFAYSTRWSHITRALKRFFSPPFFIQILDISLKYIYILGDYSLNMFYSLKLRSVGKNRKKIISLSGLIGNLFIKSFEASELLYLAMLCRCFDGKYSSLNRLRLGVKETAYLLIFIFVFAAYFFI